MDANMELDVAFKMLIAKENDTPRERIYTIKGHNVKLSKVCGRVADVTFSELCDRVGVVSVPQLMTNINDTFEYNSSRFLLLLRLWEQ